MMTKIGSAALLAGMMGIATGAAAGENNASFAGKRGLSLRFPQEIVRRTCGRGSGMLTLLKIFIGRIEEVESNCFDFMVVIMLLLMFLPTQTEGASFPKGSPEDVVDELMKFDFISGDRELADTYFEWSKLTTEGAPKSSESSPYWGCPIHPIINSYKVLGKEVISPIKVRVIVEVEMVALSAKGIDFVKKDIDLCYWPELSTTIYNNSTNEEFILKRPISVVDFIEKIEDKKLSINTYSEKTGGKIPIAKAYRKWQYKVDVILGDNVSSKTPIWRIPTERLPYIAVGLQIMIKYIEYSISNYKYAQEVCTGLVDPHSKYFKKLHCPPVEYPDIEIHKSKNILEMLKIIQGG